MGLALEGVVPLELNLYKQARPVALTNYCGPFQSFQRGAGHGTGTGGVRAGAAAATVYPRSKAWRAGKQGTGNVGRELYVELIDSDAGTPPTPRKPVLKFACIAKSPPDILLGYLRGSLPHLPDVF